MALQLLKVWANNILADSLEGNNQVRSIRDEEWVQGWGRNSGVSSQQLNSLFRLLTQHSAPSDICPYLYPDTELVQSNALELNGQTITQAVTPVLYDIYGTTLPDIASTAPTGFTWIVRKQ